MREADPVTTKKNPSSAPRRKPVDKATLDSLVSGAFSDPHSVLGPHPHDGGIM